MELSSPGYFAEKVLRLSQRMLDCAKQQKWVDFTHLESERQNVIEALFSHPAMPHALHDVAELLQEVMLLVRASIELGEQAQSMAGQELSDISQGRRAIHAYITNSH